MGIVMGRTRRHENGCGAAFHLHITLDRILLLLLAPNSSVVMIDWKEWVHNGTVRVFKPFEHIDRWTND